MENTSENTMNNNALDIAVIGMSCVFPKAKNTEEFWQNLCDGIETVKFLTDEELLSKGVPWETIKNPNYVKAASVLDDCEGFDAEFFSINPNEAKCMDPQQRIFLECCWEAFENAGYDPYKYDKDVGVFAGTAMNTYISEVLSKNSDFIKSVSQDQIMIGNDKDYLPTLVSYKLNLRGPSINVNTACSTSLVGIHLARHSLLLGECDIALAGGVSIVLPNSKGYMYMKDGIQSPDGHCRAFDAGAKGTIWGDGCGVVLLKRLNDAMNDGDNILAVIKGSAVNNDGSNKVGYTAPGVDGQSRVIVEALTVADLSPEQISYIETHGTGTQLGDLVEITALTQAFNSGTDKKRFCPIGSVKTNIGHLNTAAGIASFIKAILSVKNKKLPPSLNFESPNPKIDFENSPFIVNTKLTDWNNSTEPLRVGISSMGIGGTNCHVIIEGAPFVTKRADKCHLAEEYILVLSARSAKALEYAADNLASYLEAHNSALSLKDVAYTLQCGRHAFSHRRALHCKSIQEAVAILRKRDPEYLLDGKSVGNTDNSMLASWLRGEEVDWSALWVDSSPCRVPLPTYPFERKRFWVEPSTASTHSTNPINANQYYKKLDDMADWFYLPVWKQSMLPFTPEKGGSKCWWVFTDDFGIGDSIVQKLRAGGDTVIVAARGTGYEQNAAASFILAPSDAEGYWKMVSTLQASDKLPDGILYLWSLEQVNGGSLELDFDSLISSQEHGFFSILNLTKALNGLSVKRDIKFFAFINNVFDVLGNEELCINSSTIPGICTVMQQELENFRCSVIDILLPKAGSVQQDRLVDTLIKEISCDDLEMACAYRGTRRFVREFQPTRIEADAPRCVDFRKNGVYLVYSGMEGISFSVSKHILQNIGGKILMLEEEGFPSRENWEKWIADMGEEHPVSVRIRSAMELIDIGAEYIGTISDLEENENLLLEIEERAGRITGIIHAAGASGVRKRSPIISFTPEIWYGHFKAVGYSLITLDRIFKDRDLDFRIIISGLVSVLGGFGSISIATLSNYAKAYVTMQSRTDKQPWIAQCWDASETVWGKVRQFMPTAMYDLIETVALTVEEGIQCFERVFAVKGVVEIEISATNLNNRYRRWVKLDSVQKSKGEKSEKISQHPRPDLETAYMPPQSKTEQLLERVFSELLGIEKVGVNDDFFELGGHSLLGVQLVSKLRDIYSVDIDLPVIYNWPTTASLSTYLESSGITLSA